MMSFFKAREIEKILAFAIEAGEIAAQAFLSKDFFTERKSSLESDKHPQGGGQVEGSAQNLK